MSELAPDARDVDDIYTPVELVLITYRRRMWGGCYTPFRRLLVDQPPRDDGNNTTLRVAWKTHENRWRWADCVYPSPAFEYREEFPVEWMECSACHRFSHEKEEGAACSVVYCAVGVYTRQPTCVRQAREEA